MMTVEDTHAIHSSSNTDARLVTRRPKQLAPLQLECNTSFNTPKTSDEAQVNTDLEYTISLPKLLEEDFTSGHGSITLPITTSTTEYIRFINKCNQKREILNRNLQVGKMIFQLHKNLLEYALLQKDKYESTYAMYKEEHLTFEFRYDTTKCRPPEGDLDTGDIRFLIQLTKYYLDLQLYLDKAYKIHQRCVYYHNQIWKLKKKGGKLGAALGQV